MHFVLTDKGFFALQQLPDRRDALKMAHVPSKAPFIPF
jgi:hypothetical protein